MGDMGRAGLRDPGWPCHPCQFESETVDYAAGRQPLYDYTPSRAAFRGPSVPAPGDFSGRYTACLRCQQRRLPASDLRSSHGQSGGKSPLRDGGRLRAFFLTGRAMDWILRAGHATEGIYYWESFSEPVRRFVWRGRELGTG